MAQLSHPLSTGPFSSFSVSWSGGHSLLSTHTLAGAYVTVFIPPASPVPVCVWDWTLVGKMENEQIIRNSVQEKKKSNSNNPLSKLKHIPYSVPASKKENTFNQCLLHQILLSTAQIPFSISVYVAYSMNFNTRNCDLRHTQG